MDIYSERKRLGLTQKELADKIGVSYQTIQNWEGGKVIPKSKTKIIESVFIEKKELPNQFTSKEIALKSFSENKTAYNEQFNEIAKVEEPTGYYYPDVMAAAGVDKEVLNNEINKIPINIPNWGKDLDFINVFGDSMYPKFSSGEIIGIKEVEFAYIIYGFAYVVVLDNGDVYVKYIKKGSTIEHVVLESENKFYESKEFHLSQIKRVYQIKGVITKITM
ncbi:helix-turn-helix domain-containing protein [Flavobacterium psychrophilum]|nr:helix-turn-helix domain-containing protein [Flavobacterium psychrophilum]